MHECLLTKSPEHISKPQQVPPHSTQRTKSWGKDNHKNPNLRPILGISADQQADVVFDVDATISPIIRLFSYFPKQSDGFTQPLFSCTATTNKPWWLLSSTMNQIHQMKGRKGTEVRPTMCHYWFSVIAGSIEQLQQKLQASFRKWLSVDIDSSKYPSTMQAKYLTAQNNSTQTSLSHWTWLSIMLPLIIAPKNSLTLVGN